MTPPFSFFKKIFKRVMSPFYDCLTGWVDCKVFLFYVGYSNAEEKHEQNGQGIQGHYQL